MTVTDVEDDKNPPAVLLSHYERIIEISRQLNSTFDHYELLRQIVAASLELTNCEAASIMLIDPATGELRFEISSNLNPSEMEKIVVPLDGSFAGWVYTHGEPRVIQDVSSTSGHYNKVDDTIEFQTRSVVAVPMKTHKQVIGVLEAINKLGDGKFTETDVNLLTILAGQAAIAIENARLFRQSDFIAEMVHELRTPLLSLQVSTSLLLRKDLPKDRGMEIVQTMQSETQRLMRLTTDFLDLAQMESGRTRLEIAPFDLPALLKESSVVVEPQAHDKQVTITLDDSPFTVNGDRGKIKQVILNMFTNAIKYNRPGGAIRVFTQYQDGNQEMVRVAVEDTGYGLSKENQKQMFQKFFRAKGTAKDTQGTGLGLVITKHIIEAHEGHIWLESEEDVGTTFFFTLPLARNT
jgi:signal transduction histidine kinase